MTYDDTTGSLASLDGTDSAVLGRLAEVWARVDPVPADLVDRIGFSLTLDALHTEVAELRRVASAPAGVRADETSIEAETITFTTDVLTVMITVHAEGDVVRLDGWVTPAGRLSVELHQAGTVTSTDSDDEGRFVLEDLVRGPSRLVMRRAEEPGVPVVTPMVEL
ncbi:carboxypeptidase regulatory-like domain-containing protein [Cellulomonas fimi]|uniref:Carboxypeptidase regulatory-like domain-containing protein n=1 Tax=Cellulomonas fimi TaxID=1708 RepID=A0A7Y0LVU6_CELFI|nr:carboxypeptidase regulatory-like domain-containing protein [Cellulomonas fimi]NMR18864.1 carboxypeptidase regulatory-like domain-containing protein [Cellulomonas fimi]